MAALTARYHRKSLPNLYHNEYAMLSREKRAIVCKLAAILRLGAFLAGSGTDPEFLEIRIRRDQIILTRQEGFQSFSGIFPEGDFEFFRQIFACDLLIS